MRKLNKDLKNKLDTYIENIDLEKNQLNPALKKMNYQDNSAVVKKKKKHKFFRKKVWMPITACMLILAVSVSIIINHNAMNGTKRLYNHNFTKDYVAGLEAKKIVNNAQYLPNADYIFNNNEVNLSLEFDDDSIKDKKPIKLDEKTQRQLKDKYSHNLKINRKIARDEELYPMNLKNYLNLDKEGFDDLNDSFGNIDYSMGKQDGYTIKEIKNELNFLTSRAPIFDQWFKIPWNTESAKFLRKENFGYMAKWKFKMHYEKDSGRLTVLRVSDKFRTSIYNKKLDAFVGDKIDGFPEIVKVSNGKANIEYDKKNNIVRDTYQVMRIDYYTNDLGKEIVECNIVDLLKIDKKVIPARYEYLKNIKDTSLTRYIIDSVVKLYSNTFIYDKDDNPCYEKNGKYNRCGYELDTKMPYGFQRKFIHFNYENKDNINLFLYAQKNPTVYNEIPNFRTVLMYNQSSTSRFAYTNSYSYYDKDKSKIKDKFNYNEILSNKKLMVDDGYSINGNTLKDDYKYFADYQIGNIDWNTWHSIDEDNVGNIKTIPQFVGFKNSDKVSSAHRECIETDGFDKNTIPSYLNKSLQSLNTSLRNNKSLEAMINNLDNEFNYDAKEYNYEESFDCYFDKLTADIVDNFLLNDYINTIINDTDNAPYCNISQDYGLDIIKPQVYGRTVNLNDETIHYNLVLEAELKDYLNQNEKYQINLVFKSLSSDNYYILDSHEYAYNTDKINLIGSYDINKNKNILIKSGLYRYAFVITKKQNNKNVRLSTFIDVLFEFENFHKTYLNNGYESTDYYKQNSRSYVINHKLINTLEGDYLIEKDNIKIHNNLTYFDLFTILIDKNYFKTTTIESVKINDKDVKTSDKVLSGKHAVTIYLDEENKEVVEINIETVDCDHLIIEKSENNNNINNDNNNSETKPDESNSTDKNKSTENNSNENNSNDNNSTNLNDTNTNS